MLRRMIGEDVVLTAVLDPHLSRVKVDPGQIEQVLMNLAVNARDAMPQGGKLTIETTNVELDEAVRRTHVGAPAGPVRPADRSATPVRGMTPEVQARIFEPFFTTKGVGQGDRAGAGDRLRHRQAERRPHRGLQRTRHRARPSRSTCPASRTKRPLPANGARPASGARGTETILLVEDEDAVREHRPARPADAGLHGAGGGQRPGGAAGRGRARRAASTCW